MRFDELKGTDATVVEADVHAAGGDADGFFAEPRGVAGGFLALSEGFDAADDGVHVDADGLLDLF